jgi:hypothetical protein
VERSTVPLARRLLGPGGARGDARPPRMLGGIGAAGSNPFPRGRFWVRVHAPDLGVRASRSARPRAPPRAGWRGWTGGATRLAQLSGAGQRDKGKEIRLASGVHTPAGEGDGEEGLRCGLSWARSGRGLGRLHAWKGKKRPTAPSSPFPFKTNRFE